jgi:hypothetical protein
MATPYLYLGSKAIVDSAGNFDFGSASLKQNGHDIVNQDTLNTVVNRITTDLSWVISNTNPDAIDSLSEIVAQAQNINSTLNDAILAEQKSREDADNQLASDLANEVSTREAAISAEQSAREAGDNQLASDLTSEVNARNAAISAEQAAREAADNQLASDLATEVSVREAADNQLASDLATEVSTREAADLNLRALTRRPNTIVPLDITVYTDAQQPIAKELASFYTTDLATIVADQTRGVSIDYDGWYYRNSGGSTKINWYLNTTNGLKYGDLKNIYAHLHIRNIVSCPFLVIYTSPKNDGSNRSSWYNSRYVYIANNAQLSNFNNYTFQIQLDANAPVAPTKFKHTNHVLSSSNTSTLISTSAEVNDEILFIAIGTNSSSSAGNVEFILSEIDVQTNDGIFPYLFTNAHVLQKYLQNKSEQLYQYFFNKSVLDNTFTPTNQV